MADKIKKFFQKKKVDAKFKLAGPGHKLTEEIPSRSSSISGSSQSSGSRRPVVQTTEMRQAAAAALARYNEQKQDPAAFTSHAYIQAQVRRELEAEKKAQAEKMKEATPPPSSEPKIVEMSQHLAVSGVYFKCPMIGPDILTKEEWNVKIKEFLYEQLDEERGLTACLMIHTLNKNREKVPACVETLCKYLENIIQNPTEEKFRKIRFSNRVYQDKVASLEGTNDFLRAAGFEIQKLPFQDGEEDFWVFSENNLDSDETLHVLYDAIQSAEPISLELDRNLQVLLPADAKDRVELPMSFFNLTAEEVKREQQTRAEVIEKSMMLRTKAMREKEEQREMRKYRYSLIRVRLPDGMLLQGTFSVYEKFAAVNNFVKETLYNEELPFRLTSPTGHLLMEEDLDKTLADLRMVPAAVLTFSWGPNVVQEYDGGHEKLLKPEVLLLCQNL